MASQKKLSLLSLIYNTQNGLHEITFSSLTNQCERESSYVSIECFSTETEYFTAVNCSKVHMLYSKKEFSMHKNQYLQWHNLTNADSAGLQRGSWYEGKKTTSRNFPHCRQTWNDASTRGVSSGAKKVGMICRLVGEEHVRWVLVSMFHSSLALICYNSSSYVHTSTHRHTHTHMRRLQLSSSLPQSPKQDVAVNRSIVDARSLRHVA